MKKNLLVAFNHGYMRFFLSMIHSLSDSNPESVFDVYIMHTDLTDEDKAYLKVRQYYL